jgi:HD-GYP domain-containing protein (c-di-GMP phosphodiesterase class II)
VHPQLDGRPAGAAIADRLLAEARIDAWQHERALDQARRMRMRVEDALVEAGALSEEDLLRYLASIYQTRFVGTRKLARAGIEPAVLARVPAKAAEKLQVCPVLTDASGALSVVCADPSAGDVAKEVQLVSGAREVRLLVAMPGAVEALIRKHYHGDAAAFAALSYAAPPPAPVPEVPAAAPAPPPAAPAAPPPAPASVPALPDNGGEPTPGEVSWDNFADGLGVLVGLLEEGRGDLRGHSAAVARLCVQVLQRVDPSGHRRPGMLAAAYLHDLGKASSYHLTALNVAHYEGHRVQAQKVYAAPLGLFELVLLPPGAEAAITSQYERVDGRGFPEGRRGDRIPLEARILAAVESYADLTGHSKNPFRRRLSAEDACEALDGHRNTLFDPLVLDALRTEVLDDALRSQLRADRRRVRGVSGSLREMGLPDVVQILASGRKSGRLTLHSGDATGEVHFSEGQIHHARFGDHEGEEAFYRLLRLTEGEFELDPEAMPTRRTIEGTCEGLLLEGMRRFDEGQLD